MELFIPILLVIITEKYGTMKDMYLKDTAIVCTTGPAGNYIYDLVVRSINYLGVYGVKSLPVHVSVLLFPKR